jgi:hypothetical protein
MIRRIVVLAGVVIATALAGGMAFAQPPMLVYQGGVPEFSPRHPDRLVAFEGEPIPFRVALFGHSEAVPVWLSGPESIVIARFMSEDGGTRLDEGCVKWDRIDITVDKRTQRLAPAVTSFDIPAGGGMDARVSIVPCSGALPPGLYVLELGTSSRALAGGNERPDIVIHQAFEWRRAATPGDELDKCLMRVVAKMMAGEWQDADGTADAALRAFPNTWLLYHYKAVIAEELEHYDAAIAHLQRALSLLEQRRDAMWFETHHASAAANTRSLRQDLDRLRAGDYRKQPK